MTSQLVFTLRSAACIEGPTNRSDRRLLVDAVPASGWKGALLQNVVRRAVSLAPAAALDRLPVFRWVDDPHPFAPETWRPVSAAALDATGADRVLWLLKPPSNREPALAGVLLSGVTPVAHLRALPAADRGAAPRPSTGRSASTGIEWPQLIERWVAPGSGNDSDLDVELTTAFPVAPHRPTELDVGTLDALCADLSDQLVVDAAPPADHWRPMHGDLTPWNLRTFPDGRRVLFDWEHTAWGPPEADQVRFWSTAPTGRAEFTRLTPARRQRCREAVEFWVGVARERAARHGDDPWKRADAEAELARLDVMLELTLAPS